MRKRDKEISVIDTSSVSLRLPPSAPVSATPTEFAPQIGQFPTGEGWRKSLLSSAYKPNSRPLTLSRRRRPRLLRKSVNSRTFSGRADNACTNLLGFFVRYVRTRGSMRLRRAQSHRLSPCPLQHALATHYFLRLTRARGKSSQREGNALFDDFWYFWSRKSTREEKSHYESSRANNVRPYRLKPKSRQQPKDKIKPFIRFFFCHRRRKRKSYKKENADEEISHSAERDKGFSPLTLAPF